MTSAVRPCWWWLRTMTRPSMVGKPVFLVTVVDPGARCKVYGAADLLYSTIYIATLNRHYACHASLLVLSIN